MELCSSCLPEVLIARSTQPPTPIFLSQAVRIGTDAWKTFRELTSCLAHSSRPSGLATPLAHPPSLLLITGQALRAGAASSRAPGIKCDRRISRSALKDRQTTSIDNSAAAVFL